MNQQRLAVRLIEVSFDMTPFRLPVGDLLESDRAGFQRTREEWHAKWEANMADRLDELRVDLRQVPLQILAERSGAVIADQGLLLPYWGSQVQVDWPGLAAFSIDDRAACSLFDTMMLLYYLHRSDGTQLEGRWISFRELPGGAFYNQAFQGYSGDRLASLFEKNPESFHQAANAVNGVKLVGFSEFAYAFQPMPRIKLATVYWPGDDEFPSRGSILFDAASSHAMVLEGLAILGSRLVSMLQKTLGN